MAKYLRVTMEDGTRWDVPLSVIAANMHEHYKDRANDNRNTLEGCMAEDDDVLEEWAGSNMNWSDVVAVAERATDVVQPEPDYEDGWVNGEKEVVTR